MTTVALTFYLSLCFIIFFAVRQRTDGLFVAPQDDPYIHLALAEQIAHGHYGVNSSEPSSPSSSMLWPFLLTPLAASSYGIYEALILNALAGCCAVILIAAIVDEWPTAVLGSNARRVIAVLTLILLANLVGLTLLTMEHTLQVMLAIACAAGICRLLNGRSMPWWSIAAAATAPWVRYEDFTLTMAVGIILIVQRRRLAALLMSLAAIVPLLAFSLFLKHIGLALLPVSVLVKSGTAAAHHGPLANAFSIISQGVIGDIRNPVHWPLIAIFVGLLLLARYEPAGMRRTVLLATATAAGLHLLFGRFGWWYRYEVYIVIFSSIVLLRLFLERVRPAWAWYLVGAIALSSIYARSLWGTPESSAAIYGEQYQMHRFVTQYYHGNFAVNDLGEVSYRHGDSYVLDLFGLASIQAARQANKDAAWSQAMVQQHDVGLVMIYTRIVDIPSSWDPLGTLCLVHQVKSTRSCVLFYSTQPAGTPALRKEFQEFAQTLPRQSVATLATR